MEKSDVVQGLTVDQKVIVDSVIDDSSVDAVTGEVVYISGKAYFVDESGVKRPRGRVAGCGKYGFPTVIMRIPEPLVPFIEGILKKCEELEICRRNVEQNLLNSTVSSCLEDYDLGSPLTECMR
ncbi:MAG: hypothetical protein IJD43_08295 [Thermoguttaceae bacterium]|nr:hypothetical protein [Thermoguttaceae bacterium]